MSIKQELLQWSEACKAYEQGDFDGALELFNPIADSSKIHFNIGMIFQSLGQHEEAALSFADAVQCDNYLSVGYFQQGVSLYILQDFEQALLAFDNSFQYFRGTNAIDYTQLGLEYKLFSCEVLYNRALTMFNIGDEHTALQDLNQAAKCKQIPEHDIINDAIQYRGEGCQLFQVPQNLVYNPPKQKLANAAKVDYLGRSKVVAATDPSDNFTEFKGARGVTAEPEQMLTPIRTIDRTATRSRRPSAPSSLGSSLGSQPAPSIGGSMPRRPPPPSDIMDRAYSSGSSTVGRPQRAPQPPPPVRQNSLIAPTSPSYAESDYGTIRSTSSAGYSMAAGKLRVKVNFGDRRMIMLPADATFDELMDKIVEKFGSSRFRVMFRDEDGEFVSMTDDDDFLLCRSISVDENKIEVWCE